MVWSLCKNSRYSWIQRSANGTGSITGSIQPWLYSLIYKQMAMYQNTFTCHQTLATVPGRNIKNSCRETFPLSPRLDQIYVLHPNWWRGASGPELSLHVLLLCSLTQVTHNPPQSLCSHGDAKPETAFTHTKSRDEWLCANRDHSADSNIMPLSLGNIIF